MFNAKYKKTGEIYQILSVYSEPVYDMMYFLVWKDNKWNWLPGEHFVPPAWEEENNG